MYAGILREIASGLACGSVRASTSQRFQQRGAEHDVAVFTPLAASNVNDHASAVDVVEG